ncbi:MAG: hypothetical protein JRI34_00465 [Deltaproteobacteria bacterium]|nr:hypothetical protein [Deltaproteobacteria bacterium]
MSSQTQFTSKRTHEEASFASHKTGLKGSWTGAMLPALIIALGLSLHIHTLTWGFLYDDFIHQGVFRYSNALTGKHPWDLYDYGIRPEPGEPTFKLGLIPWWTAENFRVRYFRPVTSLSIYLDYLLYRDWASGYHLTSLLLYAAILGLAYRLFSAVGVSRRAALWALAFLAFEGTHVVPVGWIANRNTLIAILFTLLTALAFHRYHLTGRRHFLVLSLVGFLLALGGKESGLVCLPLVGLYLLCVGRPSESGSFVQACLHALRTPALWAFVLIAFVYFGGYALAERGENSALYSTPWQEPLIYVRQLAMLIPLAFSSLFFGLSTDIVYTRPAWALPMMLFSLPILLLVGIVFWRRLRSCPQAGFALGWALFALLPVAGVFLSDRLLMSASLGTALLLGLFMDSLGSLRSLWARRQFGSVILFFLLVTLGVVLSIPTGCIRGEIFYKIAAADRENIANAEIPLGNSPERCVFLLNSPSSALAMTIMPAWTVIHDDPGIYITYLQMARREVEWRRESETSCVLTFGEPLLLEHQYELLFETKRQAPPPGTHYRTAHFTATILESEDKGIRAVRLGFFRSLDDPTYHFLAWKDGRLSRVTPPAVGEALTFAKALPAMPYVP